MKSENTDGREGFSKGDQVWAVGEGPDEPSRIGVVQGWFTYEYEPTEWYCCVTWDGRFIGRYQACEIEHTARPE